MVQLLKVLPFLFVPGLFGAEAVPLPPCATTPNPTFLSQSAADSAGLIGPRRDLKIPPPCCTTAMLAMKPPLDDTENIRVIDVGLTSPNAPTLLALENSTSASEIQKVQPSLDQNKRWVKWAWIGGIAATVLVVGLEAWAISSGHNSQTFGGL